MDYRVKVATSMLFKRKGSMLAATIAVAIAVLVIVVNNVTFQGASNGIVRDLTDYQFGNLLITDKNGNINKPDSEILGYLQNTGLVKGATVRLITSASINNTRTAVPVRTYGVELIGMDPVGEAKASKIKDAVVAGTFLTTRDSIVLGSNAANDLSARLGDPLDVKVTDRTGHDVVKRFSVVGITQSPGGLAFDSAALVDIKTLRDMTDRADQSDEVLVRLYDIHQAGELERQFFAHFPNEHFQVQTVQEAAKNILEGIASVNAFINLVGYFGMLSSAFGIITIMMMIVSSKTREIGILRAIGSNKSDIMLVFFIQGTIIGSLGGLLGFVLASGYTLYSSYSRLSIGGGIALAIQYDPVFVAQTAITGMVMGIVASLYPAWRTTKLEPSEATRVD
ncbi:MAG: FtsX-like permease family protein [Nitrososphaera sp.]